MEGGAGMTIGICSLWHNATELLPEFERLLAPGGWDECILVDNASDIEARAAYAATAERTGCKVLRTAENNVCKGWNEGMAALTTDIRICMANDILMIDPDWVARVARDVGPGVMAGLQMRRFIDGTLYLDGSLIAYHALDWERLGGLDESYTHPGYVSDVDICWRAAQLGIVFRMFGQPVHHLGNYSTKTDGKVHPTWPENRDRFLRLKDEAAKKAAADGAD